MKESAIEVADSKADASFVLTCYRQPCLGLHRVGSRIPSSRSLMTRTRRAVEMLVLLVLLDEEGRLPFHSLSIAAAKTPAEWEASADVAPSPKCSGGDGRGIKL